MGQAARLEAEAEHTWQHTVAELLKVFQRALADQNKSQATESQTVEVASK
jgi:hypothetical protein